MQFEGVALEPHTETHGMSGMTKIWPEELLRESADSLSGCPVTDDAPHTSDADVIGEVVDSWYEDGTGVKYEAEIVDTKMAIRVESGALQIAPACTHMNTDTRDDGVQVPQNVTFTGLFICPAASEGVPGLGEWTILSPERKV